MGAAPRVHAADPTLPRIVPHGASEDRGAFERWASAGERAVRAQILGGLPLWCPAEDESLTPHLVRDGYWESPLSLAIARRIEPGWWCVDAGAHCGYFTMLMLAAGAEYVMAVEPVSRLLAYLASSLVEAGWSSRVHRVTGALWSKPETLRLNLYGRLTGSTGVVRAEGYDVSGTLEADGSRLDDLVGARPVRLVKVDVEGAEAEAWRGMIETVETYRPIIAMEVAGGRGYSLEALLEDVARFYPIRVVRDDGSLGDVDPARLGKMAAGEWATLWLEGTK